MLAGHLQTKKGYYYAVLNCRHPDGSRFPKWIATGIPDKKGNKKAAEEALIEFRTTYNEYGEKITSGNTPASSRKAALRQRQRKIRAKEKRRRHLRRYTLRGLYAGLALLQGDRGRSRHLHRVL